MQRCRPHTGACPSAPSHWRPTRMLPQRRCRAAPPPQPPPKSNGTPLHAARSARSCLRPPDRGNPNASGRQPGCQAGPSQQLLFPSRPQFQRFEFLLAALAPLPLVLNALACRGRRVGGGRHVPESAGSERGRSSHRSPFPTPNPTPLRFLQAPWLHQTQQPTAPGYGTQSKLLHRCMKCKSSHKQLPRI